MFDLPRLTYPLAAIPIPACDYDNFTDQLAN